MTNGGGDHGCKEEGCEEARCEEAREEGGSRQEVEEVVLRPAEPGADANVGAGIGLTLPVGIRPGQEFRVSPKDLKDYRLVLPEGLEPDEVTVSTQYDDEDENMRVVREVNEDPPDTLNISIRKTFPVALERITLNFRTESE